MRLEAAVGTAGWDETRALALVGARRRRTENGLALAESGDGPPLLLFHGGSGAWNHWIGNLAALSRRFRVLAFDLPGFGLSEDVDSEISNPAYIAKVEAAVEELVAPEAPIHLCGFSFGSMVAASLALSLGTRAAALTLIGPSGFAPPKRTLTLYGPRSLEKRLGRPPGPADLREMHRNNFSQMMLSRPLALSDPLIDLHAWNVARARFNSRRLSWSGDMPRVFGSLRLPSLIVYGELDPSQPPTIAGRVNELLALRPDCEKLGLAEVGHWAPWEAADRVNEALLGFHGSV